MGDSQLEPSSIVVDAIRKILSFFDRAAFWLLGLVYELFFNVASADLFANSSLMKFYGRMQLILGVFMMFQLALTILKGIVNPESFTDKKSGAGNFITRVVTALVLLTVLVPINVPKSADSMNEYEKQINNNGLLFGTLYSLQHRLLSNNTIGKLVLGTSDADTFDVDDNEENLRTSAKSFTATIVRGFYRVNLIPYDDPNRKHADDGDDAEITSNRMCDDMGKTIDIYRDDNSSAGDILDIANETCSQNKILDNLGDIGTGISVFAGKEMYMFTMMPLVSTAAAIIFIIIFISFTIDVAVRAIKLAVLRLIAPIPIISYMDPKGSKDSAFNSWVKSLTSTYLDLFVRLAIIYFVLFIIQDMVVNKISVAGAGALGFMSSIAVWIGLFVFAKQAPKFIRQVLGLKDEGGKGIFSGLGAAMAVGAAAGGIVSGAVSKGFASRQNGGSFFKNVGSGIVGAIGGGVNSGKAFFGSKELSRKAIMDQRRAYAAQNYSNAADDSTFRGRLMAGFQSNLGLKNDYQEMEEKIKYYGAAGDAMSRINKSFDGNGKYKFTYGDAITSKVKKAMEDKGLDTSKYIRDGNITDKDGNVVIKKGIRYTLKDMNDALSRIQASGDGSLIMAVDEAKKAAQGVRLDTLRSMSREEIERNVRDESMEEWTSNDLNAYDAARTIYSVAKKYSDEPEFSPFSGKEFDGDLSWGGAFKFSASKAKDSAEALKNSPKYSQAKANASRVEQNNKK